MNALAQVIAEHRHVFFRNLARGPQLIAAMQQPHLDLEAQLLDQAYQAEAAGNPTRARYLMDWSGRARQAADRVVSAA